MKKFRLPCRIITLVLLLQQSLFAQYQNITPVTPNASPEAKALLEYLYSLTGKYMLAGQHNYPASGDRNTQFASDYMGKTPPVWSQDFGFSADGDKDSYLSRPDIVREAIKQHKKGLIINLCWHAVPPTANEPITFQPLPGYDSTALASVQGRLLEKQFRDLLTPGTKIYKNWLKQVDEIAKYLKQLQEAKIPVIWRPYHEMNGDWFWWGGRYQGKYTTAALYRQIFDRLVNYHKLNNLIWVWSIDRPSRPDRTFDKYYPGTEYLDILALDVYGNDFAQSYYDELLKLSEGKPITLAEVGNPPAPEIIEKQPNWLYWVVWAGMTSNTSKADYDKLTSSAQVVFIEDEAYIEGTKKYRAACGFDPLKTGRIVDLSGEWKLNECESSLNGAGLNSIPYKLSLVQNNNELKIRSSTIVEYDDDEIREQTFSLDGKDVQSTNFDNSLIVINAKWSIEKDTLFIDSKISGTDNKKNEIKINEIWILKRHGKKLSITKTISGPWRTTSLSVIYDKY